MNKKITLILISLVLIGMLPFVLAAEPSYCCEKTNSSAWCQNAPQEECNTDFALSPTSCDSTGYCQEGCCFNRNDGTCSKNTPQKICEDSAGVWSSVSDCSIPQCGLGCCLIGDQAAFVSQTRCTHLASVYGLTVNYRSDITSELSCIATATADVEGACVWTEGFDNKCERTTKSECADLFVSRNSSFYDGLLCSNPILDTICSHSENTVCVEGLDPVYYLDTCGNLANVYDASQKGNETSDYWKKILDPVFSCTLNFDFSNANTCGNCDYYEGSTCKTYDNSKDDLAPTYGDKVCRNLGCSFDTNGNGEIKHPEEFYEHGETWCAQSTDTSKIFFGKDVLYEPKVTNLPGTRYFRLICYNSEVTIEPCADFRQEVCLEQELPADTARGVFSNANCVVNKWEDCISQTDEDDCNNDDLRDCHWYDSDDFGTLSKTDIRLTSEDNPQGLCVPKYTPGLNSWSGSDADSQCSIASRDCNVEYTRNAKGSELVADELLPFLTRKTFDENWHTTNNAKCDPKGDDFIDWQENRNKICYSLGDCGITQNYILQSGYQELDDLFSWTSQMDEEDLEDELSE